MVLLLAGCSPVDPKPVPNAPSEPAPAEAAAPEATPLAEDSAVAVPSTTLVGVLHEGGTRLCSEPYKPVWIERTWAVGFVPLVHEPGLSDTIAKLEGTVVKVSGVATDEPTTVHGGDPAPKTTVMCGEMQMRSDWELWPEGTRARRDDGPDLDKLRVEAIEVAQPFRGALRDDEVSFSVTNPFEHDLQDATLVAHYEGCYGKPGHVAQRRPLGAIKVGGTLEDIPVPQISMRKMSRGPEHRLDSVQLTATVESGALDLDVQIDTLGFDIECPKRK